MVHSRANIPQQPIDAPIAEELLDAIKTARELPNTIVLERSFRYGRVKATSTGKPWFPYEHHVVDYLQTHAERRRLRITERLYGGDGSRRLLNVSMQYVYMQQPSSFQHEVHGLTLHNHDANMAQHIAVFEQAAGDAHYTRQLRLLVLASGTVFGKLLQRSDTESPYTGGYVESCEQAAEEFYLQQPLLEEDYRFSAIDSVDVRYVVDEVTDFINEETKLADIRIALGYGNV